MLIEFDCKVNQKIGDLCHFEGVGNFQHNNHPRYTMITSFHHLHPEKKRKEFTF